MTDYNPISASEIDGGSPLNNSLFRRLVDNPIASIEGAEGAPDLGIGALPDLVAGPDQRFFCPDAISTTSVVAVPVLKWTSAQNGTLRVSFSHWGTGNTTGLGPTAEILVDGVVQATWTFANNFTSVITREADITLNRNDEIVIRHNVANDASGKTSNLSNIRFSVLSQWIFPVPLGLSPGEFQWSFD